MLTLSVRFSESVLGIEVEYSAYDDIAPGHRVPISAAKFPVFHNDLTQVWNMHEPTFWGVCDTMLHYVCERVQAELDMIDPKD